MIIERVSVLLTMRESKALSGTNARGNQAIIFHFTTAWGESEGKRKTEWQ